MKKKQQEYRPSPTLLKLQKQSKQRNQIFSSSLEGRPHSKDSNQSFKRKFELNPKQKSILEKPLQMKKSQIRMQSINDQKFTISGLERQKQINKQKQKTADLKQFTKKLNLKFGNFLKDDNNINLQSQMNIQKEQQINQNLIKPSKIYEIPSPQPNFTSIFQTPPLPCFQQQRIQHPQKQDTPQTFFQYQYDSCGNLITQNYKRLAKEGVWKIGKIKIRGNKSQLLIGGLKFEGNLGYGQGKIAAIKDQNFIEINDWSGMWIVQPSKQIFE